MYVSKSYEAVRDSEDNHRITIKINFKVSNGYRSDEPVEFLGRANTKDFAVEEVTNCLLSAKKDIETAIEEAATI